MNCPKCIGKLQEVSIAVKTASKIKDLQGAGVSYNLTLDKCFVCGGVWCDKGELEKYLAEGITVIDSKSLGQKLDKKLDQQDGNCPRCDVLMEKQTSEIDQATTIDRCPECEGVWLDPMEIDRLERKTERGTMGFIARLFSKKKA